MKTLTIKNETDSKITIAISGFINPEDIQRAEQVLTDNGVDDPDIVLQAIGYTLLDVELYPED